MESIVINPDRVCTVKTPKNMVERGKCEVCGRPILIATWVAKILDKLDREVNTCSRVHQNVLMGVDTVDNELDEMEG